VSVFVIDWTATGAPPPTVTLPTLTPIDFRRCLAAENAMLPSQVAELVVL
jgi:hypothetical protein